jgi:hypothetical protein
MGKSSMFSNGTHDGTIGLLKKAVRDSRLLELSFFLLAGKAKGFWVFHQW